MALSRARSRIEASERDTIAKLVAAVQAPALDMSFLPSLPSTAPARRRYRGGIVARHLIRKTAKLLSRRF